MSTQPAVDEAPRCFDCLADFAPSDRRYAVLKQMRDIPKEADPVEVGAFLWAMCHDPVAVCEDCAQWYRDAILVTQT